MELIERLQKIIEREIDNVPMVLTDPLTLRRLRAERLAQAALAALIEHAGQDGVTEVSTQDALDFIGTAMRNWRHVRFDKEELEDFRVALQLRDARHRALAFAESERLRGALGLIIENESADTGYGNSSAKIARAALKGSQQ